MSDYTASDLKAALTSDGVLVNGEKSQYEDPIGEMWWEAKEGTVISTLEYGDFEAVEYVVGKNGEADFSISSAPTWQNYVILKQGDRFFKLPGEYDSWDADGWDGSVVEVQKVKKTIEVWERKLDY